MDEPPRKRTNSLAELMSTSGRKEYAALATVFGIPEYIDSQVFWERQQDNKYGHVSVNSISVASRPISTTEDDGFRSKFFISSYVDSVLDQVGSSVNPSLIGVPTATKSFSLPRIPQVSKFNDFLIEDENGVDILLPANPSSILIPDSISTPEEVVIGTPEVFDLIMSDEDERFIIWGPDPICLSSSMATTPSSYATLYNNQYKRPELKGFSSNTTTTVNTTTPTDRGLFKRAFKRVTHKKKKPTVVDYSHLPQVIEAATVHKLIEKLTNTLDYTFMTDFFLTYRDFLNPQELCQLLISRFYWALKSDDETRKIVRIR